MTILVSWSSRVVARVCSAALAVVLVFGFASHVVNATSIGTQVGSTSSAFPVTVTITTAGTVSTVSVLTQGAPKRDYIAAVHGSTCAVGKSYNVGDTCVVAVFFQPKSPGLRNGAVSLFDASGNLLGTAGLQKTGYGPMSTFGVTGASGYMASAGISTPTIGGPTISVAVDGNGNVFVSNPAGGSVVEFFAVNGVIPASPTSQVILINGGISQPFSLALDGGGNLWVGEVGGSGPSSGALYEVESVNGSIPSTPTIRQWPLADYLAGLAVDSQGDVFATEFYTGAILELVAVNGVVPDIPATNSWNSGSVESYGLALDSNGNLFQSEWGGGVIELEAVGGVIPATPTIRTFGTGIINTPVGLAVDGNNNLYVADIFSGKLWELYAVDGTLPDSPVIAPLGTGTALPLGVTVDGRGNVYFADYGTGTAVELLYSLPPALTFKLGTVGSASADSPQTAVVFNSGNEELNIGALTYPTDFPLSPGDSSPCEAGTPIPSNGFCDLSIEYLPTVAGRLRETVVVTDNSLNGVNRIHSVVVNGATYSLPTIALKITGNLTVGGSVAITATVTGGSGVPTGLVTFYDGASSMSTQSLDGSGSTTLWTSSLPQGANSISVIYSGDANYSQRTSRSVAVGVKVVSTATVTASPNPATKGTQATVTFTVPTAPGVADATGTVKLFLGNAVLGTATVTGGVATIQSGTLGIGTFSLVAQYTGDANYTSGRFTGSVRVTN